MDEDESPILGQAMAGRADLCASQLTLTEVASILGRRCREGADPDATLAIWLAMLRWVDMGAMSIVDLVPAVHRDAERLLLRPDGPPLRAADALHLALARSGNAATFACYDQRLRAAAAQLGLLLHPPATG